MSRGDFSRRMISRGINMNLALSFLLFSLTTQVHSHGMNKLGPNGGYIKMPGAFHTELIEKEKELQVYLTDMTFKNPTTVDSSVSLTYIGEKTTLVNCIKREIHFSCPKPEGTLKGIKEILLNATRNKSKGTPAKYSVPFKID
jgi:hypothetical protein